MNFHDLEDALHQDKLGSLAFFRWCLLTVESTAEFFLHRLNFTLCKSFFADELLEDTPVADE